MSRSSERGLGRGLEALIPRATIGLREVPVGDIRPNPWQPRTHFDEQDLQELAQSIREHGVLQPVLVSQQPDGSFQLITGERRWRAVQLAGMPTVPAMVKEATPQASLEMALVENIQRRDLNPLEEAHAYRQLLDEHGLTQDKLAQRIGKSRVAVTNTLRPFQNERLSMHRPGEPHCSFVVSLTYSTTERLKLHRMPPAGAGCNDSCDSRVASGHRAFCSRQSVSTIPPGIASTSLKEST